MEGLEQQTMAGASLPRTKGWFLFQGMLFWLFEGCFKVSLGTASGIESVMVLTLMFLK